MKKKYIAFDSGHKTRGNIAENYTQLRDLLTSDGFECHRFIDMITQSTLRPFDILVFACPDFAKITPQEINEIESWVKNEGGGLLLLSHAGGDRGRSSNLNELAELFGIAFENDQVLDDKSNLGLENLPVIYSPSFNPPHTITNGIDSICYRAGCSSSIVGGAFSIATSNETSDPFSTPLICISEPGKGRVCCIGSYELFRNKVGGGIAYDTHADLAKNVFHWLISDHREDIRTSQNIPAPVAQGQRSHSQPQTATGGSNRGPESSGSVNIDSVNINYDIRISNKSELMGLLRLFADQINTMKKTIDNLIQKVSIDDSDIIDKSKLPKSSGSQYVDHSYEEQQQAYEFAEMQARETAIPRAPTRSFNTPLPGKAPVEDQDFIDYAYEAQGKHVLSSLPQKPSSFSQGEESAPSKPAPLKHAPKSRKAKGKTKAQTPDDIEKLKSEKEGLLSKEKSVKDLMAFIEKKNKAGKLDAKSYDKQIKKLSKDLSKAQNRLDAIDRLLG